MADVMTSKKYLDLQGLTYFYGKISELLAAKVDAATGERLLTTAEQTVLSSLAALLEEAGTGASLLTNSEKSKLTGIEEGANAYVLPEATASVLGGVRVGDGLSVSEGMVSLASPYSGVFGTDEDAAGTLTLHGLSASVDELGEKIGTLPSGTSDVVSLIDTKNAQALQGLNAADTAVDGSYVSAVSETNGVISVTRASLPGAVTQAANGLMTSEDKTKLDGFQAASAYALKTDIASAYRYKGSVATVAALPASADNGDVYNVEESGMNYAYTGEEWDALGSTFDVTTVTNAEIDQMMSA